MSARRFRTYHDVEHDTASGILEQVVQQRQRLADRLASIRCIVAVLSGKGGVGKSAITANLAAVLAARGARVGAVDADLNGPSLARMLGAAEGRLGDGAAGVVPAAGAAGVRVMSMELLQGAADAPLRWQGPEGDAFIWRGTAEAGTLREFIADVDWGELDYLLIDVPPGTDKIARLLDLVRPDQTLLVTTPADIARRVVARSARLLREAGLESTGIIANMTAYALPDGTLQPLFTTDGARTLARESNLQIWAELPFDPAFATATDAGEPYALAVPASTVGTAIGRLAERVERAPRGRNA
ncbi:MAG TPA: P-loop NTPase [Longimicrobiales bacterium]|nr:P-loop NTPase [Longimicrobiales bacterium]